MNKGRRRAGGSLIEFAIVTPLFWALLAGIFQFGRAICIYARLVEGVACGARYAARVEFDEPSHNFAAAVANMVVCGSPQTCASSIVTGLTAANVNVAWTRDALGTPLTITVSIRDFAVPLMLREFRWSGKPAVTTRFAGVYQP